MLNYSIWISLSFPGGVEGGYHRAVYFMKADTSQTINSSQGRQNLLEETLTPWDESSQNYPVTSFT